MRIGQGEVTWYDEDGEVTMHVDSNNKVTTYKNKQEPVAFASHGVINWIADRQFQHEADLYTSPQPRRECDMGVMCIECPDAKPKREWVGLTEQEETEILLSSNTVYGAMKLTETKLMEKNK
jgi:hypothetical protein